MSTSALSPFQQQWRGYASRFGLDVSIPFQLAVGDDVLDIPVLLRCFGAKNGMLLVTKYNDIREFAGCLASLGYGYSCLSEPGQNEVAEESSFIEMLQDWSWSGAGAAPAWLTGHAG